MKTSKTNCLPSRALGGAKEDATMNLLRVLLLSVPGVSSKNASVQPTKRLMSTTIATAIALIFFAAIPLRAQNGANAPDYVFSKLAALGDSAAGGGIFAFDFEPYGINNREDVLYVADLAAGPTSPCDIATGIGCIGEGVYLVHQGQTSALARSGDPAPGGGTFFGALGSGAFGPGLSLNAQGDSAFVFFLQPFTLPVLNAGVYRYSHTTKMVTPVVVPNVTQAPGGGKFAGASIHASLNNEGELVFAGIVPSGAGHAGNGLGLGIFKVDADGGGEISSLVSPGDRAPGGGSFDFAQNPWINDRGDVAFGAHVAGEECVDVSGNPLICGESVYVMKAATGEIRSIAHQGDLAPGGGKYRLAFGPVLNDSGEIAFIGDLTPELGFGQSLGVFLHSGNKTIAIAHPGDPMPGGGNLLTAGFYVNTYDLNNRGDVSFTATLNTETNGAADTGLYVWSRGSLHLVARTRTVIPGVGTIVGLWPPALAGGRAYIGGAMNERGQILFTATLDNGSGVLLIATPQEE